MYCVFRQLKRTADCMSNMQYTFYMSRFNYLCTFWLTPYITRGTHYTLRPRQKGRSALDKMGLVRHEIHFIDL